MAVPPKLCVDRVAAPFVVARGVRAIAPSPVTAKMVFVEDALWRPGSVLRVAFLDGDPALHTRVATCAAEWTRHANLRFDFGAHPVAHIRVTFRREEGAWSYIGTEARRVTTDPTMNLGWLAPDTPETELRRVVLHEFGHALGAIHEHQNPAGEVPWDKDAVYRYFGGPPNHWSRDEVARNVFQRYALTRTRFSTFDPASIMIYAIPPELTRGAYTVGWNDVLSETDRRWIARAYPFPAGAHVPIEVDGPPVAGEIRAHGERDTYRFTTSTTGPYVVELEGPTDTVLALYGPLGGTDGAAPRVAEDDNSGSGRNPRLALRLPPGTWEARVWHYGGFGIGPYTIGVAREVTKARHAPLAIDVATPPQPAGGSMIVLPKSDEYVLNHCTKYLARTNTEPRHTFGQHPPGDSRARVCEAWRFPVIDSYGGLPGEPPDPGAEYQFNAVTFVYYRLEGAAPTSVALVGTFGDLHAPVPLRRIVGTDYFTVTLRIPKGEVHHYVYLVDAAVERDPLNPQQVERPDGRVWSRLFTQLCTQRLTLTAGELALVERLAQVILPVGGVEGPRFFARYYDELDKRPKSQQPAEVYRLGRSLGVANFVDKLLAREEAHRLVDYRLALGQVARVLGQRMPGVPLERVPDAQLDGLVGEMASGTVAGWDVAVYGEPRFFLRILRRHVVSGAFSHPKYGGNIAAAGWAWLGSRYRDKDAQTLFDWRAVMEFPLGDNTDYLGLPTPAALAQGVDP